MLRRNLLELLTSLSIFPSFWTKDYFKQTNKKIDKSVQDINKFEFDSVTKIEEYINLLKNKNNTVRAIFLNEAKGKPQSHIKKADWYNEYKKSSKDVDRLSEKISETITVLKELKSIRDELQNRHRNLLNNGPIESWSKEFINVEENITIKKTNIFDISMLPKILSVFNEILSVDWIHPNSDIDEYGSTEMLFLSSISHLESNDHNKYIDTIGELNFSVDFHSLNRDKEIGSDLPSLNEYENLLYEHKKLKRLSKNSSQVNYENELFKNLLISYRINEIGNQNNIF